MKNKRKFKFFLIIGSLILIFFFGEIAIRTNDAIKGHNFFSNEHRDKLAIKDNSIVPYTIFGTKFYIKKDGMEWISSTHNELYRLKKPDNTFRIVCFGGSTTENPFAYKEYKIHYPMVLQQMLQKTYPNKKIEVINVGYSSYATSHLLIILTLDVISWSPDLIIMSENTNDISASYWKDFAFDYSNKYGLKYYRIPQYGEHFTTLNALFRWSSFYWYIKSKIDRISSAGGSNKMSMERLHSGEIPPEVSQYVFRRNLINFYYIASKWNIPVIFATQALKADIELTDFMEYKGDPSLHYDVTHEEKAKHHRYFNTIIKEVALNTHSYFLNNDSIFAGNSKYFIDAVHYTKPGIIKLAENYHNYIISNKLIERYGESHVKNIRDF